jgi:hypothetical protein
MTTNRLAVAFAVVALALAAARSSGAEEKQKKEPQALDRAATEKMWAEYAQPGREHEAFKELVGEWKTETKSYWPGQAEPQTSQSTATFKLIMGGRFVQQEFKGEYNGKPFEGLGIFGYDKAKKKYVSVWLDNMGTGIMLSEGTYDEASKTFTEIGEIESPTGKMREKTVTKDVDKNKFVLTMWMLLPGDKEQKVMEIIYTRM